MSNQGYYQEPYGQQPPSYQTPVYPVQPEKQQYHQQPQSSYGGPPPAGAGYGYQPHYTPASDSPQQYSQPSSYPPTSPNGPTPAGVHPEKFKPVEGRPDVWATLLFLGNFFGYVIFMGFKAVPAYKDLMNKRQTSPEDTENYELLGKGVAIAAAVSLVLVSIFNIFMRKFTRQFINFALITTVLINFLIAAVIFVYGNVIAGVVMLVCALFYAYAAYTWRSRIPFATIMMQTVIDVSRRFRGTLYCSIIALMVQIAWSALWVISVMGITYTYNMQDDPNKGALGGVMVWALFTFYWTTQVIKNVQHVTISGVFATFYFLFNTNYMPSNPTSAAASRALGKSFGPICFGSLIVAVIQTLRALANQARRDNNDNNAFIQILACLAACILSMLEDLVEYFNRYAFTQVAIYGKSFLQAAKDTWRLVKSHGIDALINDDLISNVLGITALIIGVLSGVSAYAYAHYNGVMTSMSVVSAVAGFFVGVTFQMILSEIIISGVATTFVCLAEDPQALQRTKPALYQAIAQTGVLANRV